MSQSPLRRLAALACLALLASPALAQSWLDMGKKLLEDAPAIVGDIVSNKDKLFGTIGDDEEHNMGRAAASVLVGAAPLVDDPALQSYVNTVGRWLASHTERPDLPWRFGVLEDDTVNAFAAPGGYVFVTRALVLIMRNEHELAGVLAHEIAHVLERHHVNALVKQERLRFAADTVKRLADTDGAVVDALVSASKELYARGLDQSDEFAADRAGVIIAARSGYDPYGLVHTLTTIQALGNRPEFLGFFLGTHPPTDERLAALFEALPDDLVQASPFMGNAEFAGHRARLAAGG